MPVSLPLTSGMARPTARAAPVVDGMMLVAAARPPFQSLRDGPSTVFCVAVNRPVDSITYSTPSCFQGRAAGPSLTARHLILWSLTTRVSGSGRDVDDFSQATLPPNRPWVESYLSR